MSRWAAVLAGGTGTRFWPLSTPRIPKQFLALDGDDPLLVRAVHRLGGLVPPERVLVITGEPFLDRTRELLGELPAENVLGEPRPASTAPALAWATAVALARDPDTVLLSLHADWHVGDDDAFRRTGERAFEVAERHDLLVTVGIVPSRPETGYGYIEPGEVLDGDARRVARFLEKPDENTARQLIDAGALWNSGLFAWRGERFKRETAMHAPEISPHWRYLESGDVTRFFEGVTPIAVDHSHFERSERVAVIPGRFPWDDVGTWAALVRVRPTDGHGNVSVGAAHLHEAEGCVAWAEDGTVVVDGVKNLVIVRANGVTLVTSCDRAAQLKTLLGTLPDELRTLL